MSSKEYYDFINNHELFSKWFMNEELDSDVVTHCRNLMNENIFKLNWRTSVGVTLDWKYVEKDLKGGHIVRDYGKYKSVFLDFQESRLPTGYENKPENYSVIVHNDSVNKVFYIPHIAIMSYWSAGWPRNGWNPGRYVTEPWELLKPIHDFLNGAISYNALFKQTQYKKFYASQNVFKYVYETVHPLIQSKRFMTRDALKVWTSVLRDYYNIAIEINKAEFKDRYNPRNRYTGPLERTFPFSWFDDPEKMKNPFLRYYKEIRTEYLDRIEREKEKNTE